MLLFMEREYFLNKKIRQGHLAFTPGIPQSGIEQHTWAFLRLHLAAKKYTQITPPMHVQQNHTWKHARDKADAKDKAKEEGSQQGLEK